MRDTDEKERREKDITDAVEAELEAREAFASTAMQEEVEEARATSPFPEDSYSRKQIPMTTGVLDYFPAALIEVARISKAGNDKHNPGEALHHARGKSMDHADCIVRHLMERGGVDEFGVPHTAAMAWRALALLQEEMEERGAPLARAARLPEV